ncbi:MAG: flagellar filament capping protein FliD [Lachnospiraceae bacterium]|nr:flagellar filament capping protein FliD [Lachnospiraceae bacterium]
MGSPIRMSGMVSGMDTEALVSAMVMNYTERKNKYSKAQTKLQWKQEAYSSVNSKVYGLYNKVSAFRFSSAYNMKTTTVSDPSKATITAGAKAVNGTQTLQIKKTAKSGYVTGAQLKAGTTESTTLADLGFTGGSSTITVRVGNTSKDITVSGDTKISDLVESLNKSGVKASYDENNLRMFVSAANTGVENDFSLTASDTNGLLALKAVGLSLKSDANDETYLKTASYAKGLTALDGNGNIVSYYQLDSNGDIQKDAEGNYIVNPAVADGITDEQVRQATNQSITELLTTLKNAHQAVDDATAQKATINNNIAYSNAHDAVYADVLDKLDAAELGLTEDELASKKEELISLLEYNVNNAAAEKYSYYGPEGAYTDENGVEHAEGPYIKYDKNYDNASAGAVALTDKINSLASELGFVTETSESEGESSEGEEASTQTTLASLKANVTTLMRYGDGSDYTYLDEAAVTAAEAEIESLDATIATNQDIISNSDASYWNIDNFTDIDITEMASTITDKIMTAKSVIDGEVTLSDYYNEGATRVDAEDAEILLNGAKFTSSTNTFNINGLTIKANSTTAEGETIQITTDADSQGLYDKVKEFLGVYNEVINELMKLYNADSSKGYEPLTDEEKDAMSDSEVEKWEKKIKDSLLRKDSTIGGVISAMTTSMMATYDVNGQTYSLANFGVHTMGFLNSAKNENYAYHIDGDSEDDITSGNEDKLLTAITNDPEGVQEFMTQLADGLYKSLGNKMQSSNLSSAYTIYNDKQMASEYSRYTKTIKTWEDKIADMEDRYYKQFSNMEKQLASLQSNSSSISSLLGM